MYGVYFFQIEVLLSLKNAWFPQLFLWILRAPAIFLLSLHSFKPRKNIPVFVGTTHRKPKYLEMRRTYTQ